MLLHWQKNRIALISLTYFLTETCSVPLARTTSVKKSFRPILRSRDNTKHFASIWVNFPLFFNCPPKEDCQLCTTKIATGSSYFTCNA